MHEFRNCSALTLLLTEGKKNFTMAEGGNRRSARLMALEKNNATARHIDMPIDLESVSDDGQASTRKRGKKKKIQEVYEGRRTPQGSRPDNEDNSLKCQTSTSENKNERIITYILDILEVKDKHELFSMPDNLEAYDFGESLNRPGDLATLRQKLRDGMYKTLEQFEDDVSIVLHKALDSNSPDTIPYQEAKSLQEEAKRIFQSLRSNPAYAEHEISTWHQKYFKYKKKAVSTDKNVGIFEVEILESRLRPRVRGSMKQSSMINSAAESNRPQLSNANSAMRRNYGLRTSSRPRRKRTNLDFTVTQNAVHSNPDIDRRRFTSKPEHTADEQIAMMVYNQPVQLLYNNSAASYKESLMNYVKEAGHVAKVVAKKKLQELEHMNLFTNLTTNSNTPYRTLLPTLSYLQGSSSSSYTGFFHPPAFTSQGANFTTMKYNAFSNPRATPLMETNPVKSYSCQLHTDGLLELFMKIGTPEFLESCKTTMALNTTPEAANNATRFGKWQEQVNASKPSSSNSGLMAQSSSYFELKKPMLNPGLSFLQTAPVHPNQALRFGSSSLGSYRFPTIPSVLDLLGPP